MALATNNDEPLHYDDDDGIQYFRRILLICVSKINSLVVHDIGIWLAC
jgi:hypothetical protein